MHGFPCEMDFLPLVFESHPRLKRLGRDSETRGEKNPSHMENHANAYRTCLFQSLYFVFHSLVVFLYVFLYFYRLLVQLKCYGYIVGVDRPLGGGGGGGEGACKINVHRKRKHHTIF